MAKRTYHHGDLRRALLDAAGALIAEHGVDDVTLRAVARKAGVTHAAPYHHFPDRAALLAAVAEDGFVQLERAMARAARRAEAPAARLQAIGRAYVRFAAAEPARFGLMFGAPLRSPARHPELARAAARTFELLHEAAGSLEVALIGWALSHGLSRLWADGPLRRILADAHVRADLVSVAGPLIDRVVAGVTPRVTRSRS